MTKRNIILIRFVIRYSLNISKIKNPFNFIPKELIEIWYKQLRVVFQHDLSILTTLQLKNIFLNSTKKSISQ